MRLSILLAIALTLALETCATAAVTGYVSSPNTNSSDWSAAVTGLGGNINTNVNFDSHATGVLDPNHYLASDGVTLIANGDVNTVTFGQGPGQGNTSSPPLSSGEGPHAASNYLFDDGSNSSLTISFNSAVLGAGLFVIDYFNPFGGNPLTIEAFDGVNGTGNSLGIFSSEAFNFQPNNVYFMGIVSTGNDIRSIVFTDVNSNTGDTTGIDDIRFATQQDTSAVPEPAMLTIWGLGALGCVFAAYRRKRLAA